jgi:hypothetical protein
MRQLDAGAVSVLTSGAGYLLTAAGATGIIYGYFGGRRAPPYHRWRTPDALNRPAYIRQQTEPYNESLAGQIDDRLPPRPPPTTRQPPPTTRQPPPRKMPRFRGGK